MYIHISFGAGTLQTGFLYHSCAIATLSVRAKFWCLIFGIADHRSNMFNTENFLIYGIIIVHVQVGQSLLLSLKYQRNLF